MATGKWTKPKMFQDEPAELIFQQAQRISDLKNFGPMTEKTFKLAGITTVLQFRKLGWQKTMQKLVKSNPKSRHSIFAYAIIGALQNKMWNRIPESDKAAARAFCASLKEKSDKKKKRK